MPKTISSTEAKSTLNALLAEVAETGVTVTITSHGRPVAQLVPAKPPARRFGQLPGLSMSVDFDEPLPDEAVWYGGGKE
jgi:prevent-host-death family protein